jgi:imidazolonepropionase
VLPEGAVAAKAGRIVWVGPETRLAREVAVEPGATRIDVGDRAVLPGLVDSHTHLVWAGDRADEFERRLAGESYSDIAKAGGGILRTVEATRDASLDELAASAGARIDRMARFGATTFEVKSGYGLDPASEIKLLEAARAAARTRPFEIVTTFLGAHTFPREARGSAQARRRYVDSVAKEMIPEVAARGLARFADVFVDEHAFSLAEAQMILAAAKQAGLAVKLHADQLADDGTAQLAAELGATSADHLEHASERGLAALAAAGTVAVLLPAASAFLRNREQAPARRMIELGVPVALATDLNPGTSPCESLPLTMQLGALLYGMTVSETIVAATLNAAAACGVADRVGSIEKGKRCDLLVLDAPDHRQLLYQFGSIRAHMVIAAGRIVA